MNLNVFHAACNDKPSLGGVAELVAAQNPVNIRLNMATSDNLSQSLEVLEDMINPKRSATHR